MGIWDRLGNVLKSYINDGAEKISRGSSRPWHDDDDDLNAAYEELEGFLKGEKIDTDSRDNPAREPPKKARPVPSELKPDFAELGLGPDASFEECKESYKKLLKIHHPDRFGKDSEKMKKATEKTARINAAYDRLVKWFKIGE